MSNLLASAETIKTASKIFAPAGGVRIPMIDPRDVAAVAAVLLTDEGHQGQTLVLTGPEAITYHQVAAHLSQVTGQTIQFVDVPDAAAREGLLQAGAPDWMADNLVTLFKILREDTDPLTDAVGALTGHQPRGFAEFAHDHAALFRP